MDRRAFFVAQVCASLPALRVAQFVPPTMAEPSQFNLETAVGRAEWAAMACAGKAWRRRDLHFAWAGRCGLVPTRLSPDTNSPEDCLRLAKAWASVPWLSNAASVRQAGSIGCVALSPEW